MAEIVPAILPESFEELEEKVLRVVDHVDTISIDIVDGVFAPPKTWPFAGGDAYAFQNMLDGKQKLPHAEKIEYELDMMVMEPSQYIEDWIRLGVNSFVLHIGSDTEENLEKTSEFLKSQNKILGISIIPSDSLEILERFVPFMDFIQIMGNDKIGYHGVSLDDRVYEKIRTVRSLYPHVTISIDIGVNRETAPGLIEAGATKLVSGSGIWNVEDPVKEIEFYRNL